jgi:hypothetical protein
MVKSGVQPVQQKVKFSLSGAVAEPRFFWSYRHLWLLTTIWVVVLCFAPTQLNAQRQNNHWYFGYNSALQFSTGSPVPLTNSAMATSEGSATVSDRQTGDLLFYTNGLSIWNRNHVVMPNGSGLLGGSPTLTSSTTAALIVPRPGNPNQYYVFTADEAFGPSGLRFNLVDMTLNGGLGDVVSGQKNVLVESDTYEKLAYAPRASGGYWLVTQKTDNVYCAWPITSAGIGGAVVSIAGAGTSNPSGWIKFSGDFTRMASVNPFGGVDLLGFDQTSGLLQSQDTLTIPCCGSVYGLEFSPSGRFLYVSSVAKGVYQFDLTAPSVNASSVYLGGSTSDVASLQLGPDCILYAAGGSLASIPQPDSLAPNCGFVLPALNVGTSYGLPPKVFYENEVVPLTGQVSILDSCAGDSLRFALTGGTFTGALQWDLLNASGSLQLRSSSTNSVAAFTGLPSGKYLVQVRGSFGCGAFEVLDSVHVVDCSNTCAVGIDISGFCSDEPIRIRAVGPDSVLSTQWTLTGAQDSSFTRSSNNSEWIIPSLPPGNYWIQVRSEVFCATSGTQNDTTTVYWTVEDCLPCSLFVPNAFTPNEDQINDGFFATIDSCTFRDFNLKIFNRWGLLVFESTDPFEPWEPVDIPDGVYAYRVLVQDARGRVTDRAGLVHLIR